MTAQKVEIKTIGQSHKETVLLELKEFADGWTYEVQELESGPLSLPWRKSTKEAAEEKLRADYNDAVWEIRVLKEV